MTFADIENRIYFLTNTNSTSYIDANKTIAVNRALERVSMLIMKYDNSWQFDDSNLTDLPIATATITSGQQDYTLATTHLSIDRVEIKDSNSNWILLYPIDKRQIDDVLNNYYGTSGIPEAYDKVGNSILLYPNPNYTRASSLKVYFTRSPLGFDYSDDKFTDDTGSASSTPGFNSLFHDLIPLWASYDFALSVGLSNLSAIFNEIQRKEKEMQEFYNSRSRDERTRLTMKEITFR